MAFTSHPPSMYPRHRWTGADIACDEIAVMEVAHRLFSTTFARFVWSYQRGGLTAVRKLLLVEMAYLAVHSFVADTEGFARGVPYPALIDILENFHIVKGASPIRRAHRGVGG